MITIQEFKDYFDRDFPYLPVWILGNVYNQGETAYNATSKLFFTANSDGIISEPTTTSIDWTLKTDDYYNYINDNDIQKAIDIAVLMVPVARFSTPALDQAYYYLTAHALVVDIRTSNRGVESTIEFPLSSKSAGSVSASFGIAQRFLERDIYAYYITTNYGLQYLALLIPRMRGNVGIAYGATTP